jgi:hypothetical protein
LNLPFLFSLDPLDLPLDEHAGKLAPAMLLSITTFHFRGVNLRYLMAFR